MVGPPTAADRTVNRRRLAVGLVGLVAASSVLTAAYSGADLLEVALVGVAGALVGGVLVVMLGPWP